MSAYLEEAITTKELMIAYKKDMNDQLRSDVLINLLNAEVKSASLDTPTYSLEDMLNNPLKWDLHKYKLMCKLAKLVNALQLYNKNTPIGVPDVIINYIPLLVHINKINNPDDISPSLQEECLVQLDILDHTIIVQSTGIPVWLQFDGENEIYYNLFSRYRDMLFTTGKRSVYGLSGNDSADGKVLNILYRIFHWKLRVKAFDIDTQYKKQAEMHYKRDAMAGRHAAASEKLLTKVVDTILVNIDKLKGSDLVKLFEQSINAERLSLGLNKDKGNSTNIVNKINVSPEAVNSMSFAPGELDELGIQDIVKPKDDDAMLEILVVLRDADALQPKLPDEDFDQQLADLEEITLDPQIVKDIIDNTEVAPLPIMDEEKGKVVYIDRQDRNESYVEVRKKLEAQRKAEKNGQ